MLPAVIDSKSLLLQLFFRCDRSLKLKTKAYFLLFANFLFFLLHEVA